MNQSLLSPSSSNQSGHYHAVSLSGGKDSTAMLLMMLEKNMPIDAVLFADTGMEFPEMYDHINKLDSLLFRERGIHINRLKHPRGFEHLMLNEPKKRPSTIASRTACGVPCYGNGWPSIKVRWCTGQLKTHLMTKEINRLKGSYTALSYVGIAYDERQRCKGEQYPLVDWKITEAQALQYCYSHGYDWGGLYEIYRRCSCWCCPFQRINELRKLRKHHPELWKQLLSMDEKVIAQFGSNPLGQFRRDTTVQMLEDRFAREDLSLNDQTKKLEVNQNGICDCSQGSE